MGILSGDPSRQAAAIVNIAASAKLACARQREPAWHRAERRKRAEDRVLLRLTKAVSNLDTHHGSSSGIVASLLNMVWTCSCGCADNWHYRKWCHACGAYKDSAGVRKYVQKSQQSHPKQENQDANMDSGVADLSQKVRALQLAQQQLKDCKDTASWNAIEQEIVNTRQRIADSRSVPQQIATLTKVLAKKHARMNVIGNQMTKLQEELVALQTESADLGVRKRQLELQQIGLAANSTAAQGAVQALGPLAQQLTCAGALEDPVQAKQALHAIANTVMNMLNDLNASTGVQMQGGQNIMDHASVANVQAQMQAQMQHQQQQQQQLQQEWHTPQKDQARWAEQEEWQHYHDWNHQDEDEEEEGEDQEIGEEEQEEEASDAQVSQVLAEAAASLGAASGKKPGKAGYTAMRPFRKTQKHGMFSKDAVTQAAEKAAAKDGRARSRSQERMLVAAQEEEQTG